MQDSVLQILGFLYVPLFDFLSCVDVLTGRDIVRACDYGMCTRHPAEFRDHRAAGQPVLVRDRFRFFVPQTPAVLQLETGWFLIIGGTLLILEGVFLKRTNDILTTKKTALKNIVWARSCLSFSVPCVGPSISAKYSKILRFPLESTMSRRVFGSRKSSSIRLLEYCR